MMITALKILWFLLPAGAANLIPPVAAKLFPKWDWPVDFGATFREQRLFGSHKTFRGFVFGILLSTLTLQGQCFIAGQVPRIQNLSLDSAFCEVWWLGPWFGLTALVGDLLKSFVKRQFSIKPGQSWVPWDQIDWILGVLVATYPIFKFDELFMLGALGVGFILSFVFKIIGYFFGVNVNWK